jgi:protein-tyrosine phosphatase
MPVECGSSVHVLFVCLGNICRSPTAEGVLRMLVGARQLDAAVSIDSAGLIDANAGRPPDPQAVLAARNHGVMLSGVARRIRARDFDDTDLLVAMDHQNVAALRGLAPASFDLAKLLLLGDFARRGAIGAIPDPYGLDQSHFDAAFGMIEEACHGLFDHLLAMLGPADVS